MINLYLNKNKVLCCFVLRPMSLVNLKCSEKQMYWKEIFVSVFQDFQYSKAHGMRKKDQPIWKLADAKGRIY